MIELIDKVAIKNLEEFDMKKRVSETQKTEINWKKNWTESKKK